MSQVLSIVVFGMVSVVGFSVLVSCVVICCVLDNFQEMCFIDQGGEWLVGVLVMLFELFFGYV